MTDPRNVAHDKSAAGKKHRGEEIAAGAEHAPQPGQKPYLKHEESKPVFDSDDAPAST